MDNVVRYCIKCGDELTDENWRPSGRRNRSYICRECETDRRREWRKANPCRDRDRQRMYAKDNPDKVRANSTRARRKRGVLPMNENRECSSFFGVHVAERVLSMVFNDVEVMPYGNPGYDIKCNRGKLIDVKAACARERGDWAFHIKRNTIADYFICLAFDNRDSLNLLYAWLLPGEKFSHLDGTGISPSTIDRWDAYRMDIDKILSCCDTLRGD